MLHLYVLSPLLHCIAGHSRPTHNERLSLNEQVLSCSNLRSKFRRYLKHITFDWSTHLWFPCATDWNLWSRLLLRMVCCLCPVPDDKIVFSFTRWIFSISRYQSGRDGVLSVSVCCVIAIYDFSPCNLCISISVPSMPPICGL